MSPRSTDHYRDESFINDYLAYQQRWAENIRESDRKLIEHVRDAVSARREAGVEPVVVDIGCSNGNLLRHIRAALPDVALVGGEYSEASLELCRADPTLDGIPFEPMDITALGDGDSYDIAVVNAVFYALEPPAFDAAVSEVGRILRPGGSLVVFDFFHPFPQDVTITERSRAHPEGHLLHFRPMEDVGAKLRAAGFAKVEFIPFEIPIDLERDNHYGDNANGFEDLVSHTVMTDEGARLIFRGTIYQPWCHLVARKAG